MRPAEVRKQIASGTTAPLYLLEGDDLRSRNELAAEFASLVDDGLQAFNVHSFYANEAASGGARDELIAGILSTARTLPMMAPRRVLVVHEAERLLSPRKGKEEEAESATTGASADKKRKKSLTPVEELEAYFEQPEPMTTVLFVAGALDANRRLVKLLRKHAVAVDCDALGSPADAAQWIQKRLEQDGLEMESKAINLLLASTGLRLGALRAEIEKLALYAAGERKVTAQHVEDLITPHSEPGEDFALGRAIWNNNATQALREIGAEFDLGKPAFMILGSIRAAAIRLRPDERAKRGLDAVLEADLAIKSSIGEPRYVLERLVIELCGRR
jgi:DNA polymerase-3 subunit delta